jgi:hypothetical protein
LEKYRFFRYVTLQKLASNVFQCDAAKKQRRSAIAAFMLLLNRTGALAPVCTNETSVDTIFLTKRKITSKVMVVEGMDIAGRSMCCAYPPEKGVLYSMRVQPVRKELCRCGDDIGA